MIEMILGFSLTFFLLLLSYTYRKTRKTYIYDPFGFNTVMTEYLKCQDCNAMAIKAFEKGDYIFKISSPCPKCKKGNMMITGIFYVKPKTEEELKYEELVKKWR